MVIAGWPKSRFETWDLHSSNHRLLDTHDATRGRRSVTWACGCLGSAATNASSIPKCVYPNFLRETGGKTK